MTTNTQIQIVKDLANKKIVVTRHFEATVEQVWKAWTEPELLDLWWAPRPFKAETKTMNLKPGGYWLYAMVGPDQPKIWCKMEYTAIHPPKSFEGVDMFCDESGNRNTELPGMNWKSEFHATAEGTTVVVEFTFGSQADLLKIVEMGFEAGFTAALGNLDEVLAETHAG